MTRFCSAVCLAALLVAAPVAQEPTIRAGVHTVSVYASVIDRTGRLVTGLPKDAFTVLDNGKPQDLSVFTGDRQPITIVVMLDRSGSVRQQFEHVRAAAELFVDSLGPDDRARIGSFSTAIEIDPATFTNDRGELVRILNEDLLGPGPTPLWNAAAAAMTALHSESGRRVVLMFTDGYDNPMSIGPNLELEDVRERSRSEEAMLYGIGLAIGCESAKTTHAVVSSVMPRFQGRRGGGGQGGVGRGVPRRGMPIPRVPRGPIGGMPRIPLPYPIPYTPPPRRPGVDPPSAGGLFGKPDQPCAMTKPDPGLREVAFDSGGGYFELRSTDDLGETFARVADELHRQYLLGFTPAVLDGKTHTLEVRVRDAALTVRARRSYIAVADEKRH